MSLSTYAFLSVAQHPASIPESKASDKRNRTVLFVFLVLHTTACKNNLLLNHPFRMVAFLRAVISSRASFDRDFVQADILHRCPDYCQATGLRHEDVDLISPPPHEAPETLNGIGRLSVSVHGLRKGIKCEKMLFILCQASYRFRIALHVLGECSRPIGSRPPLLSVAARCPPVRPGHPLVLVARSH